MDDVVGYTKLYYKFRNGYQLFLIDINVNVCDYIKKKIGSKLIDIVLPKIRQYLVLGQELTCPYKGQLDVKNLPLNGGLLENMFAPAWSYMVDLTANTSTNELIWNAKVYFVIPEGKTIEDDRMGR